jgi:hypothetical protein
MQRKFLNGFFPSNYHEEHKGNLKWVFSKKPLEECKRKFKMGFFPKIIMKNTKEI